MGKVYVHRINGEITKITNQPNGSLERLSENDPEIINFLDESITIEGIYDKTIRNQKLLKALVLLLNDGSFVPGSNLSGNTLKQIILAKM